jgi:hypothetical protein
VVFFCGMPSLTRRWVCNLSIQLLLGIVHAVTLRSKPCRTHDHILLSHLKLISLSVTSYGLQGYGIGILSCLHTGEDGPVKVKFILWPTVSWPVCPGVRPPSGTCNQFFFHIFGNDHDICSFFNMVHPLWWEGGYVIYGCRWDSPLLSWIWVPQNSWPYFTFSTLRLPPSWRGRILYLLPQEQGSPFHLPGTESD